MEIRIDGTKKTVKLEIFDDNHINWISDFVGNNNGFGPVDKGQIAPDPTNDSRKLATAETVKWWQDMVRNYEAMESLVKKYSDKHGADAIANYLQESGAYDTDLEDQPKSVKRALEQYTVA